MNKKGDVGEFLFLIITLFAVGLSIFAGFRFWTSASTTIEDMTIVEESTVNITPSFESVDRSFNILDPLFIFIFIGLYIAILVATFNLDSHPAFMPIAIIMFVIVIFVGMIMSDVFMSAITNDQLIAGQATYPMITHLMQYLPIYLVPMGFIFFIVLYGSRRRYGMG